jgi:hypothetical protein
MQKKRHFTANKPDWNLAETGLALAKNQVRGRFS